MLSSSLTAISPQVIKGLSFSQNLFLLHHVSSLAPHLNSASQNWVTLTGLVAVTGHLRSVLGFYWLALDQRVHFCCQQSNASPPFFEYIEGSCCDCALHFTTLQVAGRGGHCERRVFCSVANDGVSDSTVSTVSKTVVTLGVLWWEFIWVH